MKNTTASTADSNIIGASKQGENRFTSGIMSDRLFRLTIALLALLLVFILVFPLRAAGDVALHIDNGGRILDGQRLYVDFFNFNTPTIDYLNVPPVAISRLTGLHAILVYQLFAWLAVVGVAVGAGLMMVKARREDRLNSLSPWLIPAAIAISAHIAWMLVTYGQRDHLFILSAQLWAILRWYRWEGGRPAPWAAFVIGVFAATGASLKPTFALAFVLIEGYGLLRYRRWRAFFAWEIVGAGLIVGLFGAYFVLQPDILHTYLTDVAPSVSAGYGGYGYRSAADLIFRDSQSLIVLSLAALLVFARIRLRSSLGNLLVLMAILGVASVLSYALQTKGWRYHALPMMSMIFTNGGLLLERSLALPRLKVILHRNRLANGYPIIVIVICAVMGVVLALMFVDGETTEESKQPFLLYSEPGDTVIIADIDVIPIYPGVIQLERIPVSRYPAAYPLAFAYANLDVLPDDIYTPNHVPPPLAQEYLDTLVEDIVERQPQLILMRANVRIEVPTYVNVARYIKAHTDFESLLDEDYESKGIVSGYEVYVRKSG
ncbi:MAG: hypothetical protein IT320_04560 [Anaerolineae bacterium]|nr:hypothetical protein [Anaerolineae bacterium]